MKSPLIPCGKTLKYVRHLRCISILQSLLIRLPRILDVSIPQYSGIFLAFNTYHISHGSKIAAAPEVADNVQFLACFLPNAN